jgi:hypothetical protein
MFDDVVSNIVAIGALIVLTVFGLGLVSTLAAPTPRGPAAPRHPHHRPHPHPHPRPHHRPHHRPEHEVGGCAGTRFGCCPDGLTPRNNTHGTQCPPDEQQIRAANAQHAAHPAYSQTSGTSVPRKDDHPTMAHSGTPPSTTLLLIEETASGKGASVEGFGQRVRRWFGGNREGLTAKEKQEDVAASEAVAKKLRASATAITNRMDPKATKDVLAAFGTYLNAELLAWTLLSAFEIPWAIKNNDWKTVTTTNTRLEILNNLAAMTQKQQKAGLLLATPDL